MKKSTNGRRSSEIRAEYDFSKGVRGQHATRYAKGTNVVLLSADVAAAFPNSKAVNEALRVLLKIARQSVASSHVT